MNIPDEVVLTAAGGVIIAAAGIFRQQAAAFRETIDRNTQALVSIQMIVERCRFKQEQK